MSDFLTMFSQVFYAIMRLNIYLPNGTPIPAFALCFGLPVVVLAVGLLAPWADGGDDSD